MTRSSSRNCILAFLMSSFSTLEKKIWEQEQIVKNAQHIILQNLMDLEGSKEDYRKFQMDHPLLTRQNGCFSKTNFRCACSSAFSFPFFCSKTSCFLPNSLRCASKSIMRFFRASAPMKSVGRRIRCNRFSLVKTPALVRDCRKWPRPESNMLAYKVGSENHCAKQYVNYLLKGIICCEDASELA